MSNQLLYFTKNDIPYASAKLVAHNPTINEISLIGEEAFRIAVQMILIIPNEIKSQDNFDLSNKDDFDIFIEIVKSDDKQSIVYKNHFLSLLALVFPNYRFRIREKDIQLMETTDNGAVAFIDSTNFQEFQEIISNMFSSGCGDSEKTEYNPADKRAAMIAEKLKNRKKKDSLQTDVQEISISVYKRYASILSIGMKMDLNIFLSYTPNQLEDQFKRFMLNYKWMLNFKMRCAGATDLDEVEDWIGEI